MFSRYFRFAVVRLLVAAAALAFGGRLASQAAVAANVNKLDTSLKLIPADAAFYSSILHGGEMVRTVADSKAWSKLMQLQFVQMGLMQYNLMAAMPSTPPGQIQAFRNSPEGQKLLHLLGEMGSDEMFVYGDPSQVKFVELVQDVIGAVNSPMVAFDEMFRMMPGRHDARQGGAGSVGPRREADRGSQRGRRLQGEGCRGGQGTARQARTVRHANIGRERRCQDQGPAEAGKVDGVEYLVLRLDGSMIPWNEMPPILIEKLKESEAEEGDLQKIIDRVKTASWWSPSACARTTCCCRSACRWNASRGSVLRRG